MSDIKMSNVEIYHCETSKISEIYWDGGRVCVDLGSDINKEIAIKIFNCIKNHDRLVEENEKLKADKMELVDLTNELFPRSTENLPHRIHFLQHQYRKLSNDVITMTSKNNTLSDEAVEIATIIAKMPIGKNNDYWFNVYGDKLSDFVSRHVKHGINLEIQK